MANEREKYVIPTSTELGQVQVSEEVIAIMAGIAAMEVEGVASMAGSAGNLQKDIISRLGMKVLSKGVKLSIDEGNVGVNLSVVLEYGASIPEVTAKIQEHVTGTIETMTGLKVTKVDVDVSDLSLEKEQ